MDKNTWTKPEVEEFDIADETEFDPGSGPDVSTFGVDPNGGGGGGGGGGS